MKIRRGVFSNAKLNGYIRVEFDFSTSGSDAGEVPLHQQTNLSEARPAQFRFLRRLPSKYFLFLDHRLLKCCGVGDVNLLLKRVRLCPPDDVRAAIGRFSSVFVCA